MKTQKFYFKVSAVLCVCVLLTITFAGRGSAGSSAASANNTTPSPASTTAASAKAKELRAEHVYDAKVYVDGSVSIGQSKYGGRNIVPIAGGTFEGPNIKGDVLPGGADWQQRRPDGDTELYARYTLRTNDGFNIQVTNKVLQSTGYTRSVLDFEAPIGSPYEWLNHAIFLGTLDVPQGARNPGEKMYVIIGVYKLL
jgi:hypothetical protein